MVVVIPVFLVVVNHGPRKNSPTSEKSRGVITSRRVYQSGLDLEAFLPVGVVLGIPTNIGATLPTVLFHEQLATFYENNSYSIEIMIEKVTFWTFGARSGEIDPFMLFSQVWKRKKQAFSIAPFLS